MHELLRKVSGEPFTSLSHMFLQKGSQYYSGLRKVFGGLFGDRSQTGRRPQRPQGRLQVEGLDERVMLSTVPMLKGVTLELSSTTGRTLKITSEIDKFNGTGTFTGNFYDSHTTTNTA